MLAYLIRHAESLANARQSDGLNSRLSDIGHRQRDAVAKRLARAAPVAVYSSPFQRCLETAEAVAAANSVPIRVRSELCEFHHLPEGTDRSVEIPTIHELIKVNKVVIECPDEADSCDWPSLDEPFEALLDRTRKFADYLKSRWTGDEAVVVISHGSPIARLIDAWLTDAPGPSFRFIIDNAAVSAVRHRDGVSSLVCLNESSHLVGIPSPAGANFTDGGIAKAEPPSGYW